MGYYLAGFDVVGVDIADQPRYPFPFVQADAVRFIAEHGRLFDLVHASCPCQGYSATQRIQGNTHPLLVEATREALSGTGRMWVMENVPGAPLRCDALLCGATFGLRTYRHRWFETSPMLPLSSPHHPVHTAPVAKMGRPVGEGEFMHVVGNFSNVPLARSEAVMGMPWASRDGLREAIPPAYTQWIGRQAAQWLAWHARQAAA
ncbi:SAM-dependent methyltransferase [Kitasatospora sp. NPDC001547]|uniref:SAM-dependent methyltransferase n=1 Tax=Kitasatospora sp. NPDC001547 TaxID=3364015 RepID=UPI00367820D2